MSELAASPRTLLARVQGAGVGWQAARFLVAGALNTAFGYLVFALATLAGAGPLAALAVATLAGAAFNFQTSRRLVFGGAAGGRGHRFAALYTALLAANWVALRSLEALGAPQLAAQAALLPAFAALSFLAQRRFVFGGGPGRSSPFPLDGGRAGMGVLARRLWLGSRDAAGAICIDGGAVTPTLPSPIKGEGRSSHSGPELGIGHLSPAALPLHALAAVLALADVAFLLGMARPGVGMAAALLTAGGAWLALRDGRKRDGSPAPWRLWAVCAGVALGLCLLGGEGRLLYANTDWQVRDAVMADLSTHPWPVAYHPPGEAAGVLRAPLGLFMLPALAGRAFGWRAAQPALLAQDALLLAAVLALALTGVRRPVERAATLAVLCAFSGLDIVGELAIGHFHTLPQWRGLFPHLENWSDGLQYSSLVTDLFWAPNHALPAMALAAGYAAWRRGGVGALQLAALGGLSVLWSPLAVIGALPFLATAFVSELAARRMRPWAAARLAPLALGLAPVAMYLTLGGGAVEHGLNVGQAAFRWWAPFLVLEVAPLVCLAGRGVRGAWRGAALDLAIAAAMLVALPLVYVGGSNDLMMRASITPIMVLALLAASGVVADARARAPALGLSLALLTLGAATPACEVARALLTPVDPPRPTGLFQAWEAPASRGTSKATYLAPLAAYDADPLLRPAR